MTIDIHKPILTNSLTNPISHETTTPYKDYHHKNNQPIPTITAKHRLKANTNTNKNKKKQATSPTTTSPQKTSTSPKTSTPSKTSNPPKTITEMMTHVFTTITKLIDEDIEEYIRILLENLLDDDTREIICGILTEAKSPKFVAVVCDRLFRIVAAIKKQERKK